MTEPSGRRVALVTGGSRGIGRAISSRLAAERHAVVINYASNAGAADELAAEIEARGGTVLTHRADVSDEEEVGTMFDRVANELGPVSVLVNNAGITRDNLLLRMTATDFDEVIAVNLRSAFLCTKAALKGMIRSRWGRIVSISSVAGVTGNAGQANYSASKAGLIGLSKSVAKEYGGRSITANVVAPGFIATDMTEKLGDQVKEAALETITLGRFGEPEEVAAAVAFLASDEAGYITGQVLSVDGGIAL